MKNDWRINKSFWGNAILVAVTLTGLTALAWAAAAMYTIPSSRFAATMIGLMRSRVVMDNPGVTGYYERLFGALRNPMFMNEKEYEGWSKGFQDRTYDRTFRLFRFKPNLNGLRDTSEPQGLTTNSFGLLGPERSLRKPPNTRRVALLGDSLTEGWGVDQNRSWATLLENRLNATHIDDKFPRFEVLNFALPGCSLTQMLDIAEQDAPRFEPDVYLLALTELSVFRNWSEHFVRLIQLGIDAKYDFLQGIVLKAKADRRDAPLALIAKLAPFRFPVIRGVLAKIKLHADHDHVSFLVLLVPSMEEGAMSRRRFTGVPDMLASLDIPVVDLLGTFDGIPDLDPYRMNSAEVHPNARGHALILENLYTKLREQPAVWTALAGSDAGIEHPTGASSKNKFF
jgi:lysophospholipase L1-like esterase